MVRAGVPPSAGAGADTVPPACRRCLAKKSWSEGPFDDGSHTADGVIGGGQIGFNWQAGPWVLGVEGQVSWADLTGEHVANFRRSTKVNYLGSVAGRIGYAWDRWLLFYAKGGWAFAHDKHELIQVSNNQFIADASETRSGWMVGGGLEWAFALNWSAKIEYNFMDFGKDSITFTNFLGQTFPLDIDQHIHLVKVGINYRFGGFGAPVAARY
jgi:outer membrane immunogenic protein